MAIETKNPLTTTQPTDATGRARQAGDSSGKDDWDTYVESQPGGQLLQLRAWRALKCRFGWTGSAIVVETDDVRLGGAQILYRRAYGLTLAYVPRGPVVDWDDPVHVAQVLAAVEAEAAAHGAAVLKLEPPLHDSLAARTRLRALGYAPSLQTVQPPSTIRVYVDDDDDAILQRMKSKWRYNVRLAQRKDVVVRELTSADLPVFHELMATTGARDGFSVHSPDYYTAAFELLTPAHAVFLLAEYAGKPLAAIVAAHCGDTASYLWGASNNAERNRMPNHALQWAGMQWAKARGATWYDLWGVPDAIGLLAVGMNQGRASRWPAEELPVEMEQLPNHDLWGVYRFKQGFGGEALRYVGAWDKPLSPVGGRIYTLGVQARQAVQTLKQADGTVAVWQTLKRWALGRGDLSSCRSESVIPHPGRQQLTAITNPKEWRETLAGFAAPHVLQSWEWGRIKAQTGWEAHRFAWRRSAGRAPGQTPDAAFQLLRRRFVPGLPWSVGYIAKGPAANWDAMHEPDVLLAAVETTARDLGCIFVKIDPDVRADQPAGIVLQAALQRRGWRYSPNQIQFKNTAFSFLTQRGFQGDEDARSANNDQRRAAVETDPAAREEALLAGMKSKWRYNIRLAQRRGIQARAASVADLPLFYGLYAQTGARDGFLVRPYGYYLETWRTFLQAQQEQGNPAGGVLLLAEHEHEMEPLAGLFLMRYGARAWYFYGASSERRRRDMPNYLLQWEALRWSLAHGCTVYDWWGAPTDPDDPQDDLQGVWQFKQGFGAEIQIHIGAWDYPVYPSAYALFTRALPRALAFLRHRRSG